jgi:hypothetical protein
LGTLEKHCQSQRQKKKHLEFMKRESITLLLATCSITKASVHCKDSNVGSETKGQL